MNYDDIVGGIVAGPRQPAAPVDPYDRAVERQIQDQQRATRAKAAAVGAVGVNPEQAANDARTGAALGWPADVVSRNREEADRAVYMDRVDRLAATAPKAAEAVSNPAVAKLASDDLEQLGLVELAGQKLSNLARSVAAALPAVGQGLWGVVRAAGENGVNPFNPGGYDTGVGRWVAEQARTYGGIQAGIASSWRPDTSASGPIERGVYGGVESLTQSLVTLPFGGPAALTVMAATEGGRSYSEARDKGLGPTRALQYGVTQGAIEAVTERMSIGALQKLISRQPGFLKTLGEFATKEAIGEQIATLLQDLNEHATLTPDKPLSQYMAERPSRALETLVATAVAAGGGGAIGGALRAVDQRRQKAEADARAGKAVADLLEQAGQSKLRERDPESFRQFVESVNPNADVFISAQSFAQSLPAGTSIERAAQLIPSLTEQLQIASATGADLQIPVSELAAAADIAAGMAPHLKTSPDAQSMTEATTYAQSDREAELQAEAQRIEAEAVVEERPAAAQLRDDILQAILKTGRFTRDVAQRYADLHGAFYSTLSDRLGVPLDRLYAEHQARWVAEIAGDVQTLDAEGRGAYDPVSRTIAMFAKADLSTALHESGHHFLNVLETLQKHPAMGRDFATLLNWFGMTAEQWAAADLEGKRAAHEQFARGFELYLREGQAPSTELAGVFSRFRSWLLAVYKKATQLNVDVSPEVRAVFDRMLATDAQIAAQQQAQQMAALFTDPAQAGMTAEEWAQYQANAAAATAEAVGDLERRALRDMAWFSRARDRRIRQFEREAGQIRDDVEKRISLEVAQEPIFAARAALEAAPVAERIPLDWLLSTFKNEQTVLDRIGELASRSSELSARDLEMVAEGFGFESAQQMVRALTEAGPPAPTVQALVDKYMLEHHAELSSPEAIAAKADRALLNEHRARMLATELNALNKATGRRPILLREARQHAQQALSQREVRKIKPGVFKTAAARAGRAAEVALRAGNTAEAASQKRNQLLSEELHREALRILDETDKIREELTRADKADIAPRYREQLDKLLELMDLRAAPSQRELDRRESLADWIAKQEAEGFTPDIDPALIEQASRKHPTQMSIEELRGIRDAARSIVHLGRLTTKLLTAAANREFAAAVDEIVDSVEKHATGKVEIRLDGRKTWRNVVRSFAAGGRKLSSLLRTLDGVRDHGVLQVLITLPMNRAATTEVAMQAQAAQQLAAIFKPVQALPGGLTGAKVDVPGVGSLARGERLSVLLNLGNAINRQRLQGGRRWTQSQVQAIVATLSPTELQFANELWSYLDSYWPQVAALQQAMTGVAPEKVEAEPFAVTLADGSTHMLRGGYYPIAYDTDAHGRSAALDAGEMAKDMMRGAFTRSTTRRGHTKARSEEVNRPVRLNLDVVGRHLTSVIHDLAFRPVLFDANRLLSAPAVDATIREHYGPEMVDALKNHLQAVAAGDMVQRDAVDRVLGGLMSNVTRATLGLSASTALAQLMGLSATASRVGIGATIKGAASVIARTAKFDNVAAEVREQSEFMRHRLTLSDAELGKRAALIAANHPVLAKAGQVRDDILFFAMNKTQQFVDVITWQAMHDKALADGATDVQAVELADAAVRESQATGHAVDKSDWQRKHPALMQFGSGLSSIFNVWAERAGQVNLSNPTSVGNFLGHTVLLVTAPAVLQALITELLRGGEPPEDWAAFLAGKTLSGWLSMVILGREAAGLVEGYDYRGPPSGKVLGILRRAGGHWARDDWEKFIADMAELSGLALGMPTVQAARTVRGIESGEGVGAAVFGPPKR